MPLEDCSKLEGNGHNYRYHPAMTQLNFLLNASYRNALEGILSLRSQESMDYPHSSVLSEFATFPTRTGLRIVVSSADFADSIEVDNDAGVTIGDTLDAAIALGLWNNAKGTYVLRWSERNSIYNRLYPMHCNYWST